MSDRPTTDPATLPSVTSTQATVSRQHFGELWPFTVDEVTISCVGGENLYVQPTGSDKKYSLNENAAGGGDDTAASILKKDARIGAVRSYGLQTCGHSGHTSPR